MGGEQVELNPQPIPPGREAVYRAISQAVLGALLEGDEGPSGGVNPSGPGGPVMRDAAASIAIAQIASVLSNSDIAKEITSLAARAMAGQA